MKRPHGKSEAFFVDRCTRHGRAALCVQAASIMCMNQPVVARPFAAVAANDPLQDPTLRPGLLGRVLDSTNEALDRGLPMTPDSLGLSGCHWITSRIPCCGP